MKTKLIVLCAFVLASGCMKERQETAASSTAEINALFDRWKTAFEAKDVNGVMSMYAPGATLVAYDIVPPLQFRGADAYRKDYEAFFAQFDGPIRVEFADRHIEAGRNIAMAYGLERVSGKAKNGAPIAIWMRYTEGLRRIDGQWRVVHEHISVPVDMATGKARLDLKP